MMDLEYKFDTGVFDRFESRLRGELRVAIQDSVAEIRPVVEGQIIETDAFDTFALLQSVYESVWGNSRYEESAEAASEAYQSNPTKWPDIRKVFGDELELAPEVRPESPDEAWVSVAAAHGVLVEEGYRSFYGNDVPARPFMARAAVLSFPIVLARFQEAVDRAVGR